MICSITYTLSLTVLNTFCVGEPHVKPRKEYCEIYKKQPEPFNDFVYYPKNDQISIAERNKMRSRSRVCLPKPCEDVEAFSGFIPVGSDSDTSFLFFLHLKSKTAEAPLLLWLPEEPGNSSLFGQFLGNGPLGIDATGELFYTEHTLLKKFNIIYLDQPVGSGYSFDEMQQYPSTLEEATTHILSFLRRFLRIFTEYVGMSFYIAGESYGARSALGVSYRMLTASGKDKTVNLHLKGLMVGVGFLFPLLDLIDSADYLHSFGILNDVDQGTLAHYFDLIRSHAGRKDYDKAVDLLTRTVLNVPPIGVQTVFELLTGFKYHASIAVTQEPREIGAYWAYANSVEFKRIVHVNSSRVLDGTRRNLVLKLGNDFFIDVRAKLQHVLRTSHVLFYTAELDAVFPLVNIERCFNKLGWKGFESITAASKRVWYKNNNSSLELFGYEATAEKLMYNTVLHAGHHVSVDRSEAVSEMYSRLLQFQNKRARSKHPKST